jgi:hypothetical protein
MIQNLVGDKDYPFFEQDMKGSPELIHWSQTDRTNYFKHLRAWRPK